MGPGFDGKPGKCDNLTSQNPNQDDLPLIAMDLCGDPQELPMSTSRNGFKKTHIIENGTVPVPFPASLLWHGDVSHFLDVLPNKPLFDLVVSSPPYNIGKAYEVKKSLEAYLYWHEQVLEKIVKRLKPTGSLCWQVGNFVDAGSIIPLDTEFAPIFKRLGLKLRNRIIWKFGHGLHCKRRFSGRYEVIMWYTKSDHYIFNLDDIRVRPKYPGKRHYKGPKKGQPSSNPKGKNPEDVWDIPTSDFWDIPNVKSNHVEKTAHPCQFPVGLIERLVLGLSNPHQVVFDPFAGVSSAGVAALVRGRKFVGAEVKEDYLRIAQKRLDRALAGQEPYRPHNKPVYDPSKSKLSTIPPEWISR